MALKYKETTCLSIIDCSMCMALQDCIWCSEYGSCIQILEAINSSCTYSSVSSCNKSVSANIFIVCSILALVVLLCSLGLIHYRRVNPHDELVRPLITENTNVMQEYHWKCNNCNFENKSTQHDCEACGAHGTYQENGDRSAKWYNVTERPRQLFARRRLLWFRTYDEATNDISWDSLADDSLYPEARYKIDDTVFSIRKGYLAIFRYDGTLCWKEFNTQRPRISSTGNSIVQMLKVTASVCSNDILPNNTIRPLQLLSVSGQPLRQKLIWFYQQLSKIREYSDATYKNIYVRRDYVLEDSMQQIMCLSGQELHSSFRIMFLDETGIDAGGVEREWFHLLVLALLEDTLSLFSIIDPQADNFLKGSYSLCSTKVGTRKIHNNLANKHVKETPYNSSIDSNSKAPVDDDVDYIYYRFAGRIIAKAILDRHTLPLPLSVTLLKQIVGCPITFSDLMFEDSVLFKNLMWIINTSNVESYGIEVELESDLKSTFSSDADETCHSTHVLLSDCNKIQYVNHILKQRFFDDIREPLTSLLKGIYETIPLSLLSIFDYVELDLLLCGSSVIDVEDWRNNTVYSGALSEESLIVKFFWKILGSYTTEERRRLLQYVTGYYRVPANGFSHLHAADGRLCRFTIHGLDVRTIDVN